MRPSSVKSTRTTVYINDDIKLRMNALIKKHLVHNQTEIINKALASEVEKIEKELVLAKLQTMMKKFKPIKSAKSSAQLIRELRDGRVKEISTRVKTNHKKYDQ